MYRLIFEKKALSYLNKLDKQTKSRIWDKLQECKLDPFRFLKPLSQIRGFKLRVGDYRVIIDVREEIRILEVIKIGHRKNIYER
ncbi:MAG: type II toxin-antitoxin system RelE/ParE family toxin [archaeon]